MWLVIHLWMDFVYVWYYSWTRYRHAYIKLIYGWLIFAGVMVLFVPNWVWFICMSAGLVYATSHLLFGCILFISGLTIWYDLCMCILYRLCNSLIFIEVMSLLLKKNMESWLAGGTIQYNSERGPPMDHSTSGPNWPSSFRWEFYSPSTNVKRAYSVTLVRPNYVVKFCL